MLPGWLYEVSGTLMKCNIQEGCGLRSRCIAKPHHLLLFLFFQGKELTIFFPGGGENKEIK